MASDRDFLLSVKFLIGIKPRAKNVVQIPVQSSIKKIRLAAFLLFPVFAWSQGPKNYCDSLSTQLMKDSVQIYRLKKIFPLVAIDQRNSFLRTSRTNNTPVNIWGAKLGVTLYERHNLGIGLYSLENSSTRQRGRNKTTINQDLTFKYCTAFYEYSIVDVKHWEIGIPIEAGVGQYTIKSMVQNSDLQLPVRKGIVIPTGTALDIYYKPTRWLGINVMGGYRYVINNTSRLNLSDWFYSVGAAVYVRQIVQDSKYYLKKRNYRKKAKACS